MRFLAKVTIPKRVAEEASASGELQRTVRAAMEKLKPEAAYFFEQDGDRECLFVINLDVPAMLKPYFPNLDPSIFVTPVANVAEFQMRVDKKGGQPELLDDLKPVSLESRRSRPDDAGTQKFEAPPVDGEPNTVTP